MPTASMEYEEAARARGARVVIGVDEVGRGPWAGPVVAAAVHLFGEVPEGLTDSKKLSEKKRLGLSEQLSLVARVGFGEATVQEIDALNIRQATHLAMMRAIDALSAALGEVPDYALIDGNDAPQALEIQHETLVKGDAKSASIAAASVLAKIRRDQGMVALAQQFPGYGWERNAGYGTKFHQEGLRTLGVTQHHRRSFKPIHNMLCDPKMPHS